MTTLVIFLSNTALQSNCSNKYIQQIPTKFWFSYPIYQIASEKLYIKNDVKNGR